MSNPDEKKLHTYQDWLTWDGAWELINGKAYNMSLTRQPFTSLLWGAPFRAADALAESELLCVCCSVRRVLQ